jgi:hypothetical protein
MHDGIMFGLFEEAAQFDCPVKPLDRQRVCR